ncbi:MAG: LytTR family DNA-binding domain-containing protein [Bacteroidota bacterium]
MLDFLTAPYPLKKSTANEWSFILGTGIFAAIFLMVFQPFGTREFQHDYKYLFLAGYGVVISMTIFLLSRLLPPLIPKIFSEEHWTVGKHILFLILAFSLVFFACYVYKDVFLGQPISWQGFMGFFPVALSVAVFPIVGMVVGDYVVQLKRYTKGAENANRHFSKKEQAESPAKVALLDENGKTILEALPSQILYLKAADNYVEIHHLPEGQPVRTIVRNSLSRLEQTLGAVGFVRCHRSYLVNLSFVRKVSGNAQGYRLHLAGTDQSVPVARGRSAAVLAQLK